MRETLDDYPTGELSLRVFNEQDLYQLRGNRFGLMIVLGDRFHFTDEQLRELTADLDADAQEEQ